MIFQKALLAKDRLPYISNLALLDAQHAELRLQQETQLENGQRMDEGVSSLERIN